MKKILPFTPSTHLYFADGLPEVAIVFRGDKLLVRKVAEKFFLPCTAEDEFAVLKSLAGRNINNLRYADDITLMAESKK